MFKKNTFIIFLVFSCISFFSNTANAQKASIKASLSPEEILIGQQATLQLDVTSDKGANIIFPQYPDTLVTGVEVLSMLPIDTLITGNSVTYSQKYVVTSFDSASYTIPYMPVIDGVDTLESNALSLKVSTVDLTDATKAYLADKAKSKSDSLDLAKLGISDIRPIQIPPFVRQDYLNYILLGVLILLVLIGICVAIYLYRKKKKDGYFFKPEVVLPPHIVALMALDKIKDEKIWQRGRDKEYYTELTDILRKYIEGRFGIAAFEKTSDEILLAMKQNLETETSVNTLSQVLKLSDLVKFAKYTPLPDENDLSLMNTSLFINQTKKEYSIADSDPKNEDQPRETDSEEDEIDWRISKENDSTTTNS